MAGTLEGDGRLRNRPVAGKGSISDVPFVRGYCDNCELFAWRKVTAYGSFCSVCICFCVYIPQLLFDEMLRCLLTSAWLGRGLEI